MTTIARFLTAYAVAAALLALVGGCGGNGALPRTAIPPTGAGPGRRFTGRKTPPK